MPRGKKRMKLLVFTPHFWLERFCRINNNKNDNRITQIWDKTKNTTQDQIEFDAKWKYKDNNKNKTK